MHCTAHYVLALVCLMYICFPCQTSPRILPVRFLHHWGYSDDTCTKPPNSCLSISTCLRSLSRDHEAGIIGEESGIKNHRGVVEESWNKNPGGGMTKESRPRNRGGGIVAKWGGVGEEEFGEGGIAKKDSWGRWRRTEGGSRIGGIVKGESLGIIEV